MTTRELPGVQPVSASLTSRHPIFANVEAATVEALLVNAGSDRMRTGQTLTRNPGQPRAFCLLTRGALRISTLSAAGQELGLEVLQAPALWSGSGALGGAGNDIVTALEPATLVEISFDAMTTATRRSHALCQNLLADTTSRLRVLLHRQQALGLHSVPDRLRRVLAAYMVAFGLPVPEGVKIRVPLSQDDLAHDVGSTRRSVNRAVKELRECGVITKRGRFIVVLDRTRLVADLDPGAPSLVHSTPTAAAEISNNVRMLSLSPAMLSPGRATARAAETGPRPARAVGLALAQG